jgi:hypothetical protein
MLYVIEQLVVNLNSAPDGSGERVATLKSGKRVEELERSGDAVHVRLASGRDGWLRATYLSGEQPLAQRLTQRDEEITRLKDELAHAQAPAPRPGVSAPAAAARTGLPGGNAEGRSGVALFAVPAPGARLEWRRALSCCALGLAAGFVLGLVVLDRHIRRRFGGLRVY